MENNGKGIFYGVIGVATLIVAIIGATFAFFTATDDDNTTIAGNTGVAGLSLTVTKVSDDTESGLIPQPFATLEGAAGAIVGTDTDTDGEKESCIDANGNSVCQVYKIQVSTESTSTLALNGLLELDTTLENLKWAVVADAEGTAPSIEAATGNGISTTAIGTASVSVNSPLTTYVVIYLEEAGAANVDEVSTPFTGTVTYRAGDGSTGVTSTFTAN